MIINIELISFVMSLIAFVILIVNSFKVKEVGLKLAFVSAFLFLLFNRLFTNIELLFFWDFFNLLEHICQVLAAIFFVYAGYLGGKE